MASYICSFGVACLIGFMLLNTCKPPPLSPSRPRESLLDGLEYYFGNLVIVSSSYFGGLLAPLSQFSMNLDIIMLCETNIVCLVKGNNSLGFLGPQGIEINTHYKFGDFVCFIIPY
jgi:hypothetical protein